MRNNRGKYTTQLTMPVSHPRFYGEVLVKVTFDRSGDRETPDGPAEVDVLQAGGEYCPADDADFEYASFDGADVPEFIVKEVEAQAIDLAQYEQDCGDSRDECTMRGAA